MTASDNYLWVAARQQGLWLVQKQPWGVSERIDTAGEPKDVEIQDVLASIADWDEELQIYDIQSHARVGGIDLPGFAVAVAVDGNRAYVADLLGLTVIDIATPSAPRRLGSVPLSGQSYDLVVEGDIAYVVGQSGLHTV